MSNIFMRIPDLKGTVSNKEHEGWIELFSVDFHASRQIRTNVGRVTDRERSIPEFSEVEVTKQLDSASNGLFQSMYNAKVWPEVEIHVCSTDSGMKPYAKYLFKNVMVSHHSHHIVPGIHPMENLFLNYTKLESTFIDTNKSGARTSQNVISYDLATAKGA